MRPHDFFDEETEGLRERIARSERVVVASEDRDRAGFLEAIHRMQEAGAA